jgi:hypothetical protein
MEAYVPMIEIDKNLTLQKAGVSTTIIYDNALDALIYPSTEACGFQVDVAPNLAAQQVFPTTVLAIIGSHDKFAPDGLCCWGGRANTGSATGV